jgi:hypothetical protein
LPIGSSIGSGKLTQPSRKASPKPMPALAINVADAGAQRSAEVAEPPRHPTLQTHVRVSLHPSKQFASLPYTFHERRQLITTGAEPQGELEIQLVRPRPISSRSDSGSLRGSGMLGSLCAGGLPLNARTRFYQDEPPEQPASDSRSSRPPSRRVSK